MPEHAPREAHLPTPLTSFVGREREISEVRGLLERARLVTVTGAGGSGKTRLALEVARRLDEESPDPARWVELAALDRPELLPQHLVGQLSIRERPEHSALDTLLDDLAGRRLLLVLDNCEHVVDAAAALVSRILGRCAGVRILATSREALGVDGERAWLVPGLRIDADDDEGAGGAPGEDPPAAGSEAVRLFAERAESVHAAFRLTPANREAVRQICRRLDGLPLAIELAAARVPVLPPEEIARRLDDVFRIPSGRRATLERHRTLRATVEWSVRLLAPAERRLLERLGVFAGSFSLRAAEVVCADDEVPEGRVLDTLAGLVTRSLVVLKEHEGAARYQLLEIVRQYAREGLAAAPDALGAVSRRHAEYYADLAERALPDLERHHSARWAALPEELDNLRAAMQWAFEEGEVRIGHRLTGSLWWYWGRSGQWSEGALWLERATRTATPAAGREWGQVLNGAGTWAYLGGDVERGKALLQEAARVLAEEGDRVHQVMALSTLAHLHCCAGEVEAAIRHGTDAVELARGLAESWPLAHALSNGLGLAHALAGDAAAADRCGAEAFEAASRAGHHWGMAEAARARADAALDRGLHREAAAHLRVAIASARAIADPFQTQRLTVLAARILQGAGEARAAARLAGAVEAHEAAGVLVLEAEQALLRRTRADLEAGLGAEALAAEAAVGAGWGGEEAVVRADQELARLAGPGERPATPLEGSRGAVASPGLAAESPPDLEVRALGGLQVLLQGREPSAEEWRHARPRELLVHLLCHPDGLTKEQVGVAFWPEASSVQVKNSFHVLVHRLRKALGHPELVAVEGERYRIDPQATVRFDVTEFESRVEAALARGVRGDVDLARLRTAVALYRGDFMQGEVVGDWALAVHDRLARLHADALDALASALLEASDVAGAVEALETLVEREPLREDAVRRLMVALARSGRRDRALLHYRKLVVLLREELDSVPESDTEELARRLEASDEV